MTFQVEPGYQGESKLKDGECEPNSNILSTCSSAYNPKIPQIPIEPTFNFESNILTKANMNVYIFTGYPGQGSSGQPKFIADQICRNVKTDWAQYGYQTKQDAQGIAYIQIDLKQPTLITKYAVTGYPGGQHRPVYVFYLRASVDGNTFKNIAMANKEQWTNDNLGTYPFRYINTVTDPGFYRYYQFYAQGYDNQHLVIMNAGLWTPITVQANIWENNLKMPINANSMSSLSEFTTDHVLYWIDRYINWGSKTKEKNSCMNEMRNWNFEGKDLAKVNEKMLESLNVNLPLVQHRIISGRDELIEKPAMIRKIIVEFERNKETNILRTMQKDLQSIKLRLARNDLSGNKMESGNLAFGDSWTDYGSSYGKCKWFKIGNLVIISGLVKSSNFAQKTIAILPENCRPVSQMIFSLDQHSATFRVDVCTNGVIKWTIGVNTHNWISLNGITFVIDKK